MKLSLIVATLVVGSIMLNAELESIYDGTGSLINVNETKIWGGNRDEADMQVHKGKNSTVTFQVLKDNIKCTHVDIHTDVDMNQDVIIRLKSWSDKEVQETYRAKLPVNSWNNPNGVSLRLNHLWTTISITSTKPIRKTTPIYAYCRDSMSLLNNNLYEESTTMALLENDHYHLGNGSVISKITKDNGQGGYGTKHDLAVTSNNRNAETAFQVLSDKESCKEVSIKNVVNNNFVSAKVENVLVKGWSATKWKQTNCDKLPCSLNTYFNRDGSSNYMIIKIKTKAGENGMLYTSCSSQKDITFSLKEEDTSKRGHPNSCKFDDLNHDWSDKYITALCSAGIIEGYGNTGYTKFGPNNIALWQELVKVVNLSNNFYKTKKIRDSYPQTPWQQAYIDIAEEQGYYNNDSMKVRRGLAFQYIVDVFWNKKLSEEEATTFLQNKRVISKREIDRYLTRAEMAKVILNSARFSGDENGIERKLPYVNNEGTKLQEEIAKDKNMPKPMLETPKVTDNKNTKDEILKKNQDKVLKENITTVKTKKSETDNTALTKNIIGKNIIRDDFKKASAEIIKSKLEEENKLNSPSNSSKFDKNSLYFGKDKSTGKTISMTTNDKGNAIIEAKVENDNGKLEKKIIEVPRKNIEKKINIESKTDINNMRKKKSEE